MKRLLALLLALVVLALAAPTRADKDKDEKKEDKDKSTKKEDQKDKDKDKDKEKDKDKGKPKPEVKLTAEQKKELAKLSGVFQVTTLEEDGAKRTADDLKKMKVIQKGSVWEFHDADHPITKGKDTVSPDKTPKEIDSTYTSPEKVKDQTVKGIYEISADGNTIKYCWAEEKMDRPKEFASKLGSRHTLMILQRVKEGAEEKDKDKGKDKEKDKGKDKDKDKDKEKDKGKDKDKDKEKDKGKDKDKDKD